MPDGFVLADDGSERLTLDRLALIERQRLTERVRPGFEPGSP